MFLRITSNSLLLFLIVLLIGTSPTQSVCAEAVEPTPSVRKRYDQAKFYFNQLQTNKSISSSRENWLKGTRNFRRIYLSSPKSQSKTGPNIYTVAFDIFIRDVLH